MLLDAKSNVTTDWNMSHYDIDVSATLPGISGDNIIFVPGRKEGDISIIQMERRRGCPIGFRVMETLVGHMRMVRGLRYVPLRNKLISVGMDGMILLWEPKGVNANSGLTFSGNDPEEINVKKRRYDDIQQCSTGRDSYGGTASGGGRNAEQEDVDMWSDEEEEPNRRDTMSNIAELVDANETTEYTSNNTRFLPPIIRQIIEDENRAREFDPVTAGIGRRRR